jgi:CheY-like chemotaxis protein
MLTALDRLSREGGVFIITRYTTRVGARRAKVFLNQTQIGLRNCGVQKAMWDVEGRLESEALEMEDPVSEELTGRILVVDDDPHFLRVLSRILSGEKFQVTPAPGACEAIDLLRASSFDLVISDLRMPDCDGLNLLQEVRRGGNEVPIIILTAYGEVDTYLEAMNAGATEYLNKPIKSDELLRVVRSCLHARNARQKQ